MTYELKFHPDALVEWNKLSDSNRSFFKTKLSQRIKNPHIPKSRLKREQGLYKIKINRPPLRLVYYADDTNLVVLVLVIDKRDSVYKVMKKRDKNL